MEHVVSDQRPAQYKAFEPLVEDTQPSSKKFAFTFKINIELVRDVIGVKHQGISTESEHAVRLRLGT